MVLKITHSVSVRAARRILVSAIFRLSLVASDLSRRTDLCADPAEYGHDTCASTIADALPLSEADEDTNEDVAQPRLSPTTRPLPSISEGEEDMAANNSNAFPPLDNAMNSPGRSPTTGPGPQVNGNGASYPSNYMPPLPVGHQQDLNFLYQQIQELSGILQSNREKVNDVTRTAEEVAVRIE